jgi:hypothetical protein
MRWLVFVLSLTAGYGIAHALGVFGGGATAVGFALALASIPLTGRLQRGLVAAGRARDYRLAAEEMRDSDPQHYQQILSFARADPEAAAAAKRDPDGYVAVFLFRAGNDPTAGWSAGESERS